MTKCKKVGSFSRKSTSTLGLKMKVVFCPDLTAQSLVKRAEVVSLIIYYHTKNIQRSWYFFYITEKYYYNVFQYYYNLNVYKQKKNPCRKVIGCIFCNIQQNINKSALKVVPQYGSLYGSFFVAFRGGQHQWDASSSSKTAIWKSFYIFLLFFCFF